jgi:hypothetical protein
MIQMQKGGVLAHLQSTNPPDVHKVQVRIPLTKSNGPTGDFADGLLRRGIHYTYAKLGRGTKLEKVC